jgi:hypothetical protein
MRAILILATAAATFACAGVADAQTRAASPAAPSAQAGLRYLTWPGKPAPQPSTAAAPTTPNWMRSRTPDRYGGVAVAPSMAPSPVAPPPMAASPAMPPQPQYVPPRYAMTAPTPPAAQPPQTFAPRTIYDAPPPMRQASAPAAAPAVPPQARLIAPLPAPAQAAPLPQQPSQPQAVASRDAPRRYSLHRDYGMTPDRAQIPPEFFLDHLPVGSGVSDPASEEADEARATREERQERRARVEAAEKGRR